MTQAPTWAYERIKALEEENEAMRREHAYLLSRDRLCSEMANKLNKLAFENAKLRGDYREGS